MFEATREMFLVNLPVNLKEQAAIERRRREEQARLSRIFNEKYRTIGVRLFFMIKLGRRCVEARLV